MSPPLDDGVEKLQAFCDLLESTNPQLESGVADLGRLAQALSATGGRLASDLHALDSEIDGVQKEAETSEARAVKACVELGSAAEEEQTELSDVERQAAGAKEEWPKELDEKARALTAAFEELESDGWSPLDTALESERRDFERWTQDAGAALSRIGQAVTSLTAQVERDALACASAMRDTTSEPFFDGAFWEPAHAQAAKVDTDVVQSFGTQRLDVVKELGDSYADLVHLMESEAREARDDAAAKAESAAAAIRDEAEQATLAGDAAVGALEAAKVEFDSSAIYAADAEPKAAGLAGLESGIETAEGQLAEMRATMEAMSQ